MYRCAEHRRSQRGLSVSCLQGLPTGQHDGVARGQLLPRRLRGACPGEAPSGISAAVQALKASEAARGPAATTASTPRPQGTRLRTLLRPPQGTAVAHGAACRERQPGALARHAVAAYPGLPQGPAAHARSQLHQPAAALVSSRKGWRRHVFSSGRGDESRSIAPPSLMTGLDHGAVHLLRRMATGTANFVQFPACLCRPRTKLLKLPAKVKAGLGPRTKMQMRVTTPLYHTLSEFHGDAKVCGVMLCNTSLLRASLEHFFFLPVGIR